MIFWIAILAGVLFVWLAIRMGFYETWALFFNTVVSIYVSVFLAPMLIEFVPAPSGAASYHVALCLIVLAGGVFALLQGLSYVFLTGQFHIPFPRVFDIVLSGVLGFATGFLLLSFLALVLTTTPLAENKIVGIFGLTKQPQRGPTNLVWEPQPRLPHPMLRRDPLVCRLQRRRQHDASRRAEAPGGTQSRLPSEQKSVGGQRAIQASASQRDHAPQGPSHGRLRHAMIVNRLWLRRSLSLHVRRSTKRASQPIDVPRSSMPVRQPAPPRPLSCGRWGPESGAEAGRPAPAATASPRRPIPSFV